MAYYRRSERVLNRANVARSSYRSRSSLKKYYSYNSVLAAIKPLLYSGKGFCVETGSVWNNEEGGYDIFFTVKQIQ